MNNFNMIKGELTKFVFSLHPKNLYVLLSLLEEHSEEINYPGNKYAFTCDKCQELFGECGEEDHDREYCRDRFTAYCKMKAE